MPPETTFFTEPFFVERCISSSFLVVFIFSHRFAVVVKIASTASRDLEVLTFSDGTVSLRNSLIIFCICSVCNVALNFCGDSFSQINCFRRCNNVSLIIGATGFWLIVLILSHVITGL